LYGSAIIKGEVGRLKPDGTKITVAETPAGVNPITFSDDGRLFVALCWMGDALYEVDPEGKESPRTIAEDWGHQKDGPGKCGSNGMDWGPDGYLYGPRVFTDEVIKIDVDTGQAQVVFDKLPRPNAVKFDSNGKLYVVYTMLGQVIQIDINTGKHKVIAQIEPGIDNLAFDSKNRLFVSGPDDGYIYEILPTGDKRIVLKGGIITPGGVDVMNINGINTLLIADLHTLRMYNSQTKKEIHKEAYAMGMTNFISPLTVNAGKKHLVMSSWVNNNVVIWDPISRKTLKSYKDFYLPLNAIWHGDEIVVAELGTSRIIRVNIENDERETITDDVVMPMGLASDGKNLWAVSWNKGTVVQVIANGKGLSKPQIIAHGLNGPEGLDIDLDGNLLVVEAGEHRLLRINPKNGKISIIAQNLKTGQKSLEAAIPTWVLNKWIFPIISKVLRGAPGGFPGMYLFNGVSVSPTGDIFVTGDMDNLVYKVTP
jgi:sugar lactone lactonase YvrE